MFASAQDEKYRPEQFIQTSTKLNFCQTVVMRVLQPFSFLYALLFFTFWSTDYNAIKNKSVKLDGIKRNSITKKFDVPTLKKIAKMYGPNVTINDVVLSFVSVGMQKYMRNHEDMDSKSINLLMPYSLRPLPVDDASVKLNNDFAILCYTQPLNADFAEAIKATSKITQGMKNSWYPYGNELLLWLISLMPSLIGSIIVMWMSSKATMVMSNVPGIKSGYKFGDAQSVGFIGLIPGIGDLAIGISATSTRDRLYMAVQADTFYIENTQEIVDSFELLYDM